MKKVLLLFLTTLLIFLSACTKKEDEPQPVQHETVIGMWFSYLDYEALTMNQSEEEFRSFVKEAIENMKSIDVNTIYVHASAFTDALYESEIYPRSTSVSSEYDPLKIWIEEAHKNKMKIEAWINPLRSKQVGEEEQLCEQIQQWIKVNDERVRIVNGRYYLNPAYDEVVDLIVSVEKELLDKYEVDGIHLDDYFYPEGVANNFDAYIYTETIQKENISREDFRRRAVNNLVENLYLTAKKKSRTLRFGISVAGNNDNNYNMYYADVTQWIEKGTIDYLIPQIYWGFNHPIKPYIQTLEEFKALITNPNIALYSGLAAYKVGVEDQWAQNGRNEWVENDNILARQVQYALESGCYGVAYFRYQSLFAPEANVQGNVDKEIINIKNYLNTFQPEQ